MMHEDSTGNGSGPGLSSGERERRNRGVMFSILAVCGLALFLVLGLPDALIAPALGQIFALAAIGATFVAILWREPLFPAHFTHWDKAAVLMGLSVMAGVFTDPALVEQTLAELGASGGPGEPAADRGSPESLAAPRAGTDSAGL